MGLTAMQTAGQSMYRIVLPRPLGDASAQFFQWPPPGIGGCSRHAQAFSKERCEVVDAALILMPDYPLHQGDGEWEIGESAAERLCRRDLAEEMYGADTQRRPHRRKVDAMSLTGGEEEAVTGFQMTVSGRLSVNAVTLEHSPEIPVRICEIVQPAVATIDKMGADEVQRRVSHIMKVQKHARGVQRILAPPALRSESCTMPFPPSASAKVFSSSP